jgi:HEAT repeat protein
LLWPKIKRVLPMIGANGQRILLVLCGLTLTITSGCADADIFPTWMPFQGKVSDTMPGVVTPAERIAELQQMSEKAATKSAAERQQVSQKLVASIRVEKDPLIRVEILRTLGHYPGSEADAVLKAALADSDTHVRMVTCEAWGRHGNAEAVKLLSDMLRSDVDIGVRMAAAKALGETKNSEAVAALGEALSDADPAMQYRAAQSLQKVTGKDFGNDVGRWQQYVKGEQSAPPPSLAERFRRLF